jgi:predicted DNA-binding transcriptional regulator YafY
MVENPFFYKPFIDSLGKSVIVREPKELKETIIEEARELLVKYALKKTTI